jgi:GNAT superfamily N-acetyltransferase
LAPVAVVREADLPELLPLLRAYRDFYDAEPGDRELLRMSRALIADPEREGLQLIARDVTGEVIGFATIFRTWSTLSASRIAVMNDLFVAPAARGRGTGEALARLLARCVAPDARRSLGSVPRPDRLSRCTGSGPSARARLSCSHS